MMELLSEEEIMEDYVLGKMIRYNHRYRLQDENVATHSFFVSLFCLKIMAKLNLDSATERQVLILAALHDTPESRTSDIPHDVKVQNPEMREILSKIEDKYFDERWKAYKSIVCEPSKLVHAIVKLADSYSVYQYCTNENTLGNVSDEIMKIKADAVSLIRRYAAEVKTALEENKNE